MNLSGHYFYYGDRSSEAYGLKILHLDTERLKKLAADVEYKTTFDKSRKKFLIKGIDYSSSPATFDIEFISEEPIPDSKAAQAAGWLFNRTTYRRLYSDIHYDNTKERVNGAIKREFINCVFYNPSEIRFADGLHGWQATCMAETVMATQEEVTYTFTSPSGTKSIMVDTDIDDYVYPSLKISTSAYQQYIGITNLSDQSRDFRVSRVPNGTVLFIDNAHGTITSDSSISYYGSLVGRRFFRLVPGNNDLTFSSGMGLVEIKFENARWLV